MRTKGYKQLMFDIETDVAREALEAFWAAYIGLLLILDVARPGVDTDSLLFP